MTRDEAHRLVARYSRHLGAPSGGLDDRNIGGLYWPDGQLYFEYVPGEGTLVCRALVLKPRAPVHPRVMPLLEVAARAGEDTGGGVFELHEPSQGIYLTRTYGDAAIPFDQLASELDRLARTGTVWVRGLFLKVMTAAPG